MSEKSPYQNVLLPIAQDARRKMQETTGKRFDMHCIIVGEDGTTVLSSNGGRDLPDILRAVLANIDTNPFGIEPGKPH